MRTSARPILPLVLLAAAALGFHLASNLAGIRSGGLSAAPPGEEALLDGQQSPFPLMSYHAGYSICIESSPPLKWTPCGGLAYLSALRNVQVCEEGLKNVAKWHRLGCPDDPDKPACQKLRTNRCHRVWAAFVCGCDTCEGMAHFQPGYEYTDGCVRNWCDGYRDAVYDGSPAQPAACKPVPPGGDGQH